MAISEMEKVSFKRRKLVNTKLRDFTNSSRKQFKVNDPCEIDSLRPYDKCQFKHFNKWLDRKVYNKKPIDLMVGNGEVEWFLLLKTPRKWVDGKVRIFLFVSSLSFQIFF